MSDHRRPLLFDIKHLHHLAFRLFGYADHMVRIFQRGRCPPPIERSEHALSERLWRDDVDMMHCHYLFPFQPREYNRLGIRDGMVDVRLHPS